MKWVIIKYLITATVIVAASEISKRSDKLGAMIVALPMVTVLTLVWLNLENQPTEKIANHAWYTFWYVLPTLPMFLIFPVILKSMGFWMALVASMGITIACFWVFALFVRQFGIDLFL